MPPQWQADGKDAGDGTADALVLDGNGATMAVATVTLSAVVMRRCGGERACMHAGGAVYIAKCYITRQVFAPLVTAGSLGERIPPC